MFSQTQISYFWFDKCIIYIYTYYVYIYINTYVVYIHTYVVIIYIWVSIIILFPNYRDDCWLRRWRTMTASSAALSCKRYAWSRPHRSVTVGQTPVFVGKYGRKTTGYQWVSYIIMYIYIHTHQWYPWQHQHSWFCRFNGMMSVFFVWVKFLRLRC